MRKRNLAAILLIIMMIATSGLTGCSSASKSSAEKGGEKAPVPGGHEAYGFSYAVPETDWIYMFNADQLGSGDEWVDLEISGHETEKGLEAEWKEAIETNEIDGEVYELEDSGKESVGGKDCYWYDRSDGDGCFTKTLLIPQAEGNKYIEIVSDFIESGDKDKADAYFEDLLKGIEFTDDEDYIACDEYISAGGVHIPAQGLNPAQFFYGLMDLETTDGLASVQIDFFDEDYPKGVEKVFDDLEFDDTGRLLGDGTIQIDGITGKWYTWLDEMPDSLPYMSHVIMVPVDDLQTIMRFEYNFDGTVKDLSRYDGQINELQEKMHFTKAS